MAKKKKKSRTLAAGQSTFNGHQTAEAFSPEIMTVESRPNVDAQSEEPGAWSDRDERFWQVAAGLLLLGIILRQLWLDRFPFHPDEAIHAWFSVGFGTYNYDPVYHGPVLYHLTAAVFTFTQSIFNLVGITIPGANDYTARLVPSILGIALLALILFGPLRRWIGPRATLWALGLVAISPVIVTYSRRLLHDSLVLLLTFAAILCFQTARENAAWTKRGRASWMSLAVVLTLFVAAKANAFFIIAMLGGFWAVTMVQGWFASREMERHVERDKVLAWIPLTLFFIASVASYYALRDENLERNEKVLRWVYLACVGAMGWWLLQGPRLGKAANDEEIKTDLSEPQRRRANWQSGLRAAWLSVFLFAFLFGHGWQWWQVPRYIKENPANWALQTRQSVDEIKDVALDGLFGRPSRLNSPPPDKDWEHSSMNYAQDWDSVVMALPRMIDYWGGQQQKPRLPGRHDYYLVLMSLYELPIALLAIGGVWYASRNRTPFTDLLLWWAFTSFVLYALANEKVPWLLTHIMLPFCLLGGICLAQWRPQTSTARNLQWAVCGLGALFLLRNVSGTNYERAVQHREPMFYAQTSEDFVETLLGNLQKTAGNENSIWVHGDKQWPPAWYLRENAPWRGNSGVGYSNVPGPELHRLIVTTPEDWATKKNDPRWKDWQSKQVVHYVWPRASWPALRPDRYTRWWLTRYALVPEEEKALREGRMNLETLEQSIIKAPGEWSHNETVVAIAPGS